MFQKVSDASFIRGEHEVLRFWMRQNIFDRLRNKNKGKPKWSFLDGPITANNPMGVHHAWGRTYKDTYQRYFAMTGHDQRFQNGFDCQGLWVEVEVEKQLNLGSKNAIEEYGIDKFVNECKRRVLRFAARQTEQSVRLGYWMDWDDPDQLRKLADALGTDETVTLRTPSGKSETGKAHELVARLGNPAWGGSYFTFSTENNETIWTFLKKCFTRQKIYKGHDVMPWSGRGGSAYSQMEVADGRRLTTHKSVFVRLPLRDRENEFLLVWTTTPWTLTSNVACMVNPELDYVKVKANKDDAIYYFAKENLEYQRLGREYKEGFGRPEWSWPDGVPKLKTIAQIFKEQGGYEELGTIKGVEMIGWEYDGPFDDLPAQQQPGGSFAIDIGDGYGFGEYGSGTANGDGFGDHEEAMRNTAVAQHRVIDGGRDSKGSPHVVAGEGTGIVHSAPGCGDIDHKIGMEHGFVAIAPLRSDGRFGDGFGDFTGREAIDPETAELVFEKLREKNLLVATETYPHIYPHCWRTGDELVFRLVDEWFINMDWRDEIKDVTRQIEWLPPAIDGQNREVEWLTNMGDWMISKKRFWGLALPIWFDDATGDFEVIGSLGELKERAVAGWDDFAGNTPHRPWIDRVKIKNPKTGNLMTRIQDVGNPWLDAGIVPFSTMHYNTNHEEWQQWFPADLVTECFPGQFRNWFYSLLALGTMMRYDETDDPAEKRPFKTLLGHRLVMNEQGQPMHKSDGTAIWFEEAAEQLGVDTMRWMYLAQNPAVDLRFGTRHPNEPVTLETVEGSVSETREGLPICKVTSTPSDEIRRQILIPLWNSYAFFINYARLDEFDREAEPVPLRERMEIDRWILSNLQAFIGTANRAFQAYNAAAVCAAAALFIDDLSNWYIRRNRRRFWRSKDSSDTDKLAAYQTLYEVLLTLTKALAPMIPFLTERMYQNLKYGAQNRLNFNTDVDDVDGTIDVDDIEVDSVHLCDYPQPNAALLDPDLNSRAATAQKIVKLGHKLREEANLRVRQPLAEIKVACASKEQQAAIEQLTDIITDELNIKTLTPSEHLDEYVRYSYKPNLKTLGPKYGKLLGKLRQLLPTLTDGELDPIRKGGAVTITVAGESVTLEPDDVLVSTEQATDWISGDSEGIQIAVSTVLSPELIREGMRNDFVRHIQQMRKDADLEIQDRIAVHYVSADAELSSMVEEWSDYIKAETLADQLEATRQADHQAKEVLVGDVKLSLWMTAVK